jgi:LEA14-like dessication related protein
MRTPSRRSILIVLLTAGSLVGGCSITQAPSIGVGSATIADETDEALELNISLDLNNPKAEPLELLEARYTVRIDGRRAYAGRWAAEATVRGTGEQRVTIPAVVRFDEFGWTSADRPEAVVWTVRGSLLYVEPGELAELLLDAGIRRPRVAFSGEGRLRLADAEGSE